MQALALSSPDTNSHRQDEPYRRAFTSYVRPTWRPPCTHLTGGARLRAMPWRRKTPTRSAAEFLQDLQTIDASLSRHHGEALAAYTACSPLIRAVQVFGFHLATVDLRQSSDKHEAVLADLLRTRPH